MVKPQFLTTIHRIKTSLSWFLLLCLITADLYAIPSFTENVVSTAADGVWGVYVADVDGDGDRDIIRASREDNKGGGKEKRKRKKIKKETHKKHQALEKGAE